MNFFVLAIILYASFLAYDRPGLIPRHFLVFYLCSRVGVVPSILLAIPPYSKAPRLLGSAPSYSSVLVVATADPHPLFSASLRYSPRVTG